MWSKNLSFEEQTSSGKNMKVSSRKCYEDTSMYALFNLSHEKREFGRTFVRLQGKNIKQMLDNFFLSSD